MKAPLIIELDPDQPSNDAVKLLLKHLLSMIKLNEAGVIENQDIEYLHDFRIAVRKTRTIFGQFKETFPERIVESFTPEWAWLGKVTGEPRDLDIYLLQFDEIKSVLPTELQTALDPLYPFLQKNAQASHLALNEVLQSKRYRKLMQNWLHFLEKTEDCKPKQAKKSIHESAHRRIAKNYKRLVKQGLGVKPETPAEKIHELRKTAKKLRYLLDMFHSLYPKTKPLIKQLKEIQEILGQYQDRHVQIEKLKLYSEDMQKIEAIPQETFLAIAETSRRLSDQQPQLKKEIKKSFETLADHPGHF